MKKSKALKIGAASSIIALTLAGCGLFSSPKDDFTKAYSELAEAKTIVSNSTFTVDASTNVEDPTAKEIMKALSGLSVEAKTISDFEKGLNEVDLGLKLKINPVTVDLDMNVLADVNEGKAYMKTEGLVDLLNTVTSFSGFPLSYEIPAELEGKIIELSGGETSAAIKEAKKEASSKRLTSKFGEYVADLPEEDFIEKDNVVTVKLDGEKVKKEFLTVASEQMGLVDNSLTQEDIDEMITEFESIMTIGEITINATIDKGSITKQQLSIPLSINDPTSNQKIDFVLKVDTTYEKINEAVEFSYDLEKAEIVTMEEAEAVLNEALFQ